MPDAPLTLDRHEHRRDLPRRALQSGPLREVDGQLVVRTAAPCHEHDENQPEPGDRGVISAGYTGGVPAVPRVSTRWTRPGTAASQAGRRPAAAGGRYASRGSVRVLSPSSRTLRASITSEPAPAERRRGRLPLPRGRTATR